MARRARMLALLQLSSVFLLVVELTYTAPVPDGSSINIIDDGRDRIFSEKSDVVAHTSAPNGAMRNEDHATTVQGSISVSEEEVNVHEDSMVTKASSVEGAEENVAKDGNFRSTKSEEMAGATDESEEVSEENMNKHKDSLSIKNEDGGNAVVSNANEGKHEDSLVTSSEEDGKKKEGSDTALEENVGKHEDHTSTETEEDTSASGANDALRSKDHATTIEGNSAMSEEEVNKHEDSVVTRASSVENAEENGHKDEDFRSTKSEEMTGATEESEEVSEENMDKPKNSLSTKNEEDGSAVVADAKVDKHEDSPVTSSEDEGKKTEGGDAALEENVGKHEDSISTETEGDASASGANDAFSEESVKKNEVSKVTKTEEHTSDTEAKENAHKVDGSITDTTREGMSTQEDRENVLEENMGKHEAQAIDHSTSKEQIGAAVNGDEDYDSNDTSKDKIIETVAAVSTSPDKGSKENKDTEGEQGTVLNSSSVETPVAENEAEDIKVKDNQSNAEQEGHVTSSPFAQLRMPSSDSQHIEKDEPHNDKDAAVEGHESQNPSIEETAENEAGSSDELIENDSVDSEVIKSDNKTAALGKAMEITGAKENIQNKDESDKTEGLQQTKQDSETPVVLNELENTEGNNSIEHQDTNSGEKKVESTVDKAPETTHDTESEETVLYGTLLEDKEEKNEKDNFLDKEDRLPEGHFEHRNEDGEFAVAEETLNILHATENPSEEEGSGGAAGMIEFVSNGDNGHNDTSEASNKEKLEAGSTVRKDNNNVVVSEEENTSEETGHHPGVFEDSGSGYEEEEPEHIGKQENNGTDNVEDGTGSGSHALHEHYEDSILSEEHTTESNVFSHVPIVDDNEESSAEYYSESAAPENETSSKMPTFGHADNQNESSDHHLKEENLAENKTNVQVMSVNPVPVPNDSDDHHVGFDGSGDDTTTPAPVLPGTSDEVLANVMKDIIDDSMEVSSKEMDFVNTSVIGEASPAYQEKPVEKVISPKLESAPHIPTTEPPCIEDDCLPQSNKPYEDTAITNILEDDDEVPPEPTKADVHSKSTSNDLEVVVSTTPAVKVSSEEESLQQSIAVDLNEPHLHFSEEATTIAAEMQEITEPSEDFEAMDNETVISSVEHPHGETGVKEMSGKLKVANVNELGVSGQENSEDLGESEALDSSTASGSYVVLGCIMAVVVVLLAYAAIKSRRERATNTSSKKQSEIAGDDDDGTELKDMKKALLPPETPHDDCNGDIEANRKPLMDKDENQEDEEKEPIIKQNGTLELSEPPRDKEGQLSSSPEENQLKTAPIPTSNKPQQRNGLSEVVVEKPAMSNGKTDSIITHPVSAKVKVIENEDSIAKTPVIINRGSNSPSH